MRRFLASAEFRLPETPSTLMEPAKPVLEIRSPTTNDAQQVSRLVSDSGVLDPNSVYLYLLLCRDFSDTCLVALHDGAIAGFLTGYRLPDAPGVLFVWQIGVANEYQRQGIALKLLREQVKRAAPGSLNYIEATVAHSNVGSRRLFESLAESLDALLIDVPDEGFVQSDFPTGQHEAEPRLRIGPLN